MNQEIDFDKMQGLLPAIVQDAGTRRSADAGLYEPGGV